MNHKVYLSLILLAGSLNATLWVDEETLRNTIQTHPTVQSKVIYARFLMEHDRTEEALDILKGLDTVKNLSVSKLIKDIQGWKRDKAYLKELNIDSTGSNTASVALGLSPQNAEKLYRALERFHISVDVATQRILGNKIAQGANKMLAGSILTKLPKEVLVSQLSVKPQEIAKTPVVVAKKEKRTSDAFIQQSVKAKVQPFDEKLSDALTAYTKDSSMKNIEVVSYLYTQMDQEEDRIVFLKQHVKNYPFDYEVRLLLGKSLGWLGRYDEALDYLYTIEGKHKYSAKLVSGQVLAWKGNYAAAKPLLDEVVRFGNDLQKYDAKKNLAYIARWQGDDSRAKELFVVLNNENPQDEEVQEEVFYDQKNFTPLIIKYEALQKKSPQDIKITQRLSSLLILDDQEQKALYYLEKQYAISHNPSVLIEMANTALRLKETTKGLNYWKVYAMKVDTAQAWLEYVKNLIWSGYSNEALVILEKIKSDSDVSSEVKILLEQINPSSSSEVTRTTNSLRLAQVPAPLPLSSDLSDAVHKEEADYAEYLRKNGKLDEAARTYRSLYLRTSIPVYGQLYVQTLNEAGHNEEANAIASVLMIDSVPKSDEAQDISELGKDISTITREDVSLYKNKTSAHIGFASEQMTDSDGLIITSGKVIGGLTTSNGISLNGEVGGYDLRNKLEAMHGSSGFFSVGSDALEGGIYVDNIDGKTEFNPYLRFSYPIAPHTLSLTSYRRNVGLVKNAIAPLKKGNTLTSLQLSDYTLFSDNDEFWGAAEIAWDEEGNTIFTPQFQYRFYQMPISSALWSISVDGWYIFNSRPTADYYSPKFTDGTYLTNSLEIPIYEKAIIKLMGGIGYSDESRVYLYKLGGWIERAFTDGITFRLGCSNNKSIGTTGKIIPYSYDTCDAKFLFNW